MSHSTAYVRFGDGTVMWNEYNGTSDHCPPGLYETGPGTEHRATPLLEGDKRRLETAVNQWRAAWLKGGA